MTCQNRSHGARSRHVFQVTENATCQRFTLDVRRQSALIVDGGFAGAMKAREDLHGDL